MTNDDDTSPPEVSVEATLPSLFDADTARRLYEEEGFAAFFERVRPSLAALAESLWRGESGASAPELAVTLTQTPELISETPNAADRDELQAFLLEAICDESGYPPDIIELDADLEADLGIDTVKQAQVLGSVARQVPAPHG